jgi:integrase
VKYSFESPLAKYIVGLIEQKRADGFRYIGQEYVLKKFDDFCFEGFPDVITVTQEIFDAWSTIRATEGKNTRRQRVSLLRQLCSYMLSLGVEAYVSHDRFSGERTLQYIPTKAELELFFAELDSWQCGKHGNKAMSMRILEEYKIMFRLYYCCGLRLSEARLLKHQHIDLNKGIMTIMHSKGMKDRLVYLPQDGIDMLSSYVRMTVHEFPATQWIFPGESFDRALESNSIHQKFVTIWNLAFDPATNKRRPSVHCLRHAFVVERMNDWMNNGVNLKEMMPYLSKFLGHASSAETYYYYHLVDQAFAMVRQKDTMSGRVIPEVISYEES